MVTVPDSSLCKTVMCHQQRPLTSTLVTSRPGRLLAALTRLQCQLLPLVGREPWPPERSVLTEPEKERCVQTALHSERSAPWPCTVNGQLQCHCASQHPPNPLKLVASHFCFKDNAVGAAFEEHGVTRNHAVKGCRHSKACEHRRAQPNVFLSPLYF